MACLWRIGYCISHSSLITWYTKAQRCVSNQQHILKKCSVMIGSFSNYGAYSAVTEHNTSYHEKCLGVTASDQKDLLKQKPVQTADQRLIKVAIIGAPNAGKSTLLNRLVGWKVAPVSQKVHTTRTKTVGVLTQSETQVVFLDTPGIIVPGKMKQHNLETSLLVDPHIAIGEADLVDISRIWNRSQLDPEILKLLQFYEYIPSVLVLNKVDLLKDKKKLFGIVRTLTAGVVGNRQDWASLKTKCKTRSTREFYDRLMQSLDNESSSVTVGSVVQRPETDGGPMDVNENGNSVVAAKAAGATESSNRCVHDKDVEHNDDCMYSALQGHHLVDTAAASCHNQAVPGVATDTDSNEQPVVPNLREPKSWSAYYRELSKVSKELTDRRGWDKFDMVFMISAIDGDGVIDIKNYLLDAAHHSSWLYSSSVVTNQNPIALAKLVVKECLLNNLPDEVPYAVSVKMTLWELDANNFLHAAFDINCTKKRQQACLLRNNAVTLRTIASEAKQQLMNTFRQEMSLKLTVKLVSPSISG